MFVYEQASAMSFFAQSEREITRIRPSFDENEITILFTSPDEEEEKHYVIRKVCGQFCRARHGDYGNLVKLSPGDQVLAAAVAEALFLVGQDRATEVKNRILRRSGHSGISRTFHL